MADDDRHQEGSARPKADERGRYVMLPELLRTDTIMNVALIVLGVYMLQAFLSSSATDVAARLSVAAWAVAIPLLAFLVLLNQLQTSYRYASFPLYLVATRGLAQGTAVIGFGAAVWHLWAPASLIMIASGLAGVLLYQAYFRRLERDNRP